MRVLLDTHVLIWWFREQKRLSPRVLRTISESRNTVLISPASGFEIATKENMGKLDWRPFVVDLDRWIEEAGFVAQPITLEHSVRAGLLPFHHRDPFDRLLVAQAQSLNVPILSVDSVLDQYGVQRIW
jgi:PIN domain nuclease of toxin-antitoxin system